MITEARPCRNADASACTYTVDPRDYARRDRARPRRAATRSSACWHTHTHTDPYPSPTDVRQAVDPTWMYVIVSLRDDAPMLRAYRIRDGDIAEIPVVLDRG